jgi:hypothetical protein
MSKRIRKRFTSQEKIAILRQMSIEWRPFNLSVKQLARGSRTLFGDSIPFRVTQSRAAWGPGEFWLGARTLSGATGSRAKLSARLPQLVWTRPVLQAV